MNDFGFNYKVEFKTKSVVINMSSNAVNNS